MTEPSQRLFFALWPDDAVRDALVQWQKAVLPRGIRPTHRLDLHITLHFLGQVPSARVDELKVLGGSLHLPAFPLLLDQLGVFARARVLWAGASCAPQAMLDLHEDLGEGLRELDFALDTRKFHPHVTLARKVREKPEVETLPPIEWTVRQWALVESQPGRVPLYRPLATWSLDEN